MGSLSVFYIKDFRMRYSTSEFESLYTHCFPPAMRLAMSLLHEEEEARDVVHEVFLKLWESGGRVTNPQAYVMRSVRNSCLNSIEKHDARERIRRRLTLEPPPAEEDLEWRNEEVMAAIRLLLTAREREMVGKIYSEGMSYKETAASLGVSVSAVNKNIVAALKKLRNHFKMSGK